MTRLRLGIAILLVVLSGPSSYAINTEATGYQVVNGAAAVTINPSHSSSCRLVSNSSGKDQFVATKTATEWASFLAHVPSGMTATPCGGSPPALVQSNVQTYASATSGSISLPSAATIGNTVTFMTAGRASTDSISTLSGCGATFSKVASIYSTNINAEIWVGVCTTTANTFSWTNAVALLRSAQVMEFSGLTGAKDVSDAGSNANSFTNTTPGVTTTRAATVIIAAGGLDKTGTAGAGPSNSFVNGGVVSGGGGGNINTGFFAYRIVSATGTYSTTWTLSGTGSPNSCFISAAIY